MGTIPTHKLTGVVVAAGARNAAKTMGWPERLPIAAPVVVAVVVAVVVEVPVSAVEVEVPVGAAEVEPEVPVGAAEVELEVSVGAAEVEVVAGGVVAGVVVGAAVVGVVTVGVGDGVADGLADALTTCKGWQDSLRPVVVAAVACPLMAAKTPPEAAVSRAPPAIKVTARRCPLAIRILINIDHHHCERSHLPGNCASTSFDQVGTVRGCLDAKPHSE